MTLLFVSHFLHLCPITVDEKHLLKSKSVFAWVVMRVNHWLDHAVQRHTTQRWPGVIISKLVPDVGLFNKANKFDQNPLPRSHPQFVVPKTTPFQSSK